MIKLRTLLSEEKEAFKLEREKKLSLNIEKYQEGKVAIEIWVSDNKIGKIQIWNYTPYDELNSMPPKPNYLYVSDVYALTKGEGYGYLLYREALKYAQKNKFKGLVSCKNNRQTDAVKMWDRLKTFSDRDYDYVDIKDLGTRINESTTNGFSEVSFLGTNVGSNKDEIYIIYDNKWDPVRASIYKTSPILTGNKEDWEVNDEKLFDYKWSFRRSKNPLFFYLTNNLQSFIWWIKELGYVELNND